MGKVLTDIHHNLANVFQALKMFSSKLPDFSKKRPILIKKQKGLSARLWFIDARD